MSLCPGGIRALPGTGIWRCISPREAITAPRGSRSQLHPVPDTFAIVFAPQGASLLLQETEICALVADPLPSCC